MPETVVPIRSADEGFTLIELIVYLSLFTVILVIVGGFMISSLRIERDVTSVSAATDSAQLVATSVQSGVRNASGVRVETSSTGDQMMVARTTTRDATGSWVCQAWYYSASNKAVYTKRSAVPAAVISWPTASPAGSWSLLGEGITPIESGRTVFGPAGSLPSSGRVVGSAGDTASMTFEATTASRAPVRVETSVSTRIDVPAGAPCFS